MENLSQIITWIPQLLEGAKITIALTVSSVSAGLLLSVAIAYGKLCSSKIISFLSSFYVFFLRGTPLLLQLYFIYYALPQISPYLTIQSRFLAAFITFTLNSSAYLAEVVRSAILSVDKGQTEAARALGLSLPQTFFTIILPQSLKVLLPPLSNEFILALKDASIVSIIALADITRITRNIASSTSSGLVYLPAMLLYLVITAFFEYSFRKLEKNLK